MAKKSGDIYVPDRGDVIWLDFEPTRGFEINKRRPALVLSPKLYNGMANLAIVCPITSRKKGYPSEVYLMEEKMTGVILVDQIRSCDWAEREAQFITRAPVEIMEEVIDILLTLVD